MDKADEGIYRKATSSSGYQKFMSKEIMYVSRRLCEKQQLIVAQIKYLRVPDEIIDIVKEQQSKEQSGGGYRGRGGGQRGDHGGRGDRGRGGRGGGRGRGRGGRGA